MGSIPIPAIMIEMLFLWCISRLYVPIDNIWHLPVCVKTDYGIVCFHGTNGILCQNLMTKEIKIVKNKITDYKHLIWNLNEITIH